MDLETKTHLEYIRKGIDEIKSNCVTCWDKFDNSQKAQWESINKNRSSVSKLKGWVTGILGAGVVASIVLVIFKIINH